MMSCLVRKSVDTIPHLVSRSMDILNLQDLRAPCNKKAALRPFCSNLIIFRLIRVQYDLLTFCATMWLKSAF